MQRHSDKDNPFQKFGSTVHTYHNLHDNHIEAVMRLEFMKSQQCAVLSTSVLKKPLLFTKWPKFTMLFHYVKKQAHSSLQSPNLPLTGPLKRATV